MDNYQVVIDEARLKEFIEWLPELKDNEKYYLCLFARSKYLKDENGINRLPHIKTDKAQLKRFISDKERMLDKIKQLEIPLGLWKQREHEVPQEALALYITPNPRDMFKATINTMVKLAQSIRDNNVMMNPHQEALSEIQKAKGTKHYIDFDLDLDGSELEYAMETIEGTLGNECIKWLKSRGGVHCLVNPQKVKEDYKNKWYQLCDLFSDQSGDLMIPVPGTYQGGFTPYFIN